MNSPSRAIVLAAALACACAHAAEFTVTPVRIFMTARDRAVALTVTNDSTEEIVMQADLFSWKQKADGTDDLQPTEDLVLSPPILKVPPRSRQVVRLARVSPPPAGEEQTYRIIVREIPEARTPAQGQVGVQLSLAFSLPIFVTPPGAKRSLDCKLVRSAPDTVQATCQNTGTAYAQIRNIEMSDGTGKSVAARETGGYILPGITRSFELKSGQRIASGAFKLQVGYDDGNAQAFPAVVAD
jgi:fimbrial chaperone protein